MTDIRILLIDDEPHVLSALQRVLRRVPIVSGSKTIIECYESPLQALDAALERAMDAVICDYRMQELDGVETLRRMKMLQPYAGRIMLSGLRDFKTVVDAINVAHVGRVVPKPWEEEALIGALREVIELRRLQLENQRLADQVRVQQGLLSKHEAELHRIEAMWPGITKVEWGADGSITITENNPA